jgi:hypothetical protein
MRVAAAQWALARRYPEFWGSGREMALVEPEGEHDDNADGGGFTINVNLSRPTGSE